MNNFNGKKHNDLPPEDIYIFQELPPPYEMAEEDEILCEHLANEIIHLFEGHKIVIAYETMRQVCEYIEEYEEENDLD